MCARSSPRTIRISCGACSPPTRRRASTRSPIIHELKKVFIAVTKLDDAVVDKQLKERTELTHNKIGPAQRDSILAAGVALQKAGVIGANVDVKKAVDDLIDDRYVTVTN